MWGADQGLFWNEYEAIEERRTIAKNHITKYLSCFCRSEQNAHAKETKTKEKIHKLSQI